MMLRDGARSHACFFKIGVVVDGDKDISLIKIDIERRVALFIMFSCMARLKRYYVYRRLSGAPPLPRRRRLLVARADMASFTLTG